MGIRAKNASCKAPPSYSLLPIQTQTFKMTMWADNVKFVKDILDSKYQKIDSAVHEFTESSEALQKDVTCNKSKEHFLTAIRTLELMQTTEIEMLLETIISVVVTNKWDVYIPGEVFKTQPATIYSAGDEREGEGHAGEGGQGEGCQEKHLLGEGQRTAHTVEAVNSRRQQRRPARVFSTFTNKLFIALFVALHIPYLIT